MQGCALLGQPPDRVTVLMDFVTRNDYNTPQVQSPTAAEPAV